MKAEEVYQCGKCGLCLTACPVYGQMLDEAVSPRGKIQQIRQYAEKNLPASAHLNELVHYCLMCQACTANCPSGVRHDVLFMRMRTRMTHEYGDEWLKKAIFHFRSHEQQLDFASRIARLGRNKVLTHLVRDVKVGAIPVKNLPHFNRRAFRSQVGLTIEPCGDEKGVIYYFTGCATNYLFESVGHAAVKVLTRMGFKVVIPQDQVCCGLPLFFHGAGAQAQANMLKNISVFNQPDIVAVITDCATCGSALGKEYPAVLKELGLDTQAAQTLAAKVKDISAFVYENIDQITPHLNFKRSQRTVTYHSPCHLRNTQGVEAQVENLLNSLPGVNYVRTKDMDSCCGGGGTFFYDHPAISQKIVTPKIDNARATGAELWAAGCPGCRLNLAGNLDDTDKIELIHPIQLVAASLSSY